MSNIGKKISGQEGRLAPALHRGLCIGDIGKKISGQEGWLAPALSVQSILTPAGKPPFPTSILLPNL
jgi:hypothetical protein